MNIFKRIINRLRDSDSVKALGKEKGFTGAGIDTRYAAEKPDIITDAPDLVPVGEVIRYRRRARDAEQKLEAAADALNQIAGLTRNNPKIDPTFRESIHKIASDGYEAAK